MADSDQSPPDPAEWVENVEELNRSLLRAAEENVEAQTRFVESWMDAVDGSLAVDQESVADGYAAAYETWMEAADEQFEQTSDALAEGEFDPDELRDAWLSAANEAFSEVMSTTAFAGASADAVGDALEVQRQVDEAAEDTLHALGFATEGDVETVGARLVELERRQQAVEDKLDRILDAVEDGS